MTKTEYYQLPQWEANDPLRREDFNGAMANIDAALADETLQEQSLARLRRMGCDLYQAVGRSICAGVPGGTMRGAVFNNLKSAEELSRVSGMLHLEGGGCLIGPSTAMTLDKLNAGIYSWENGETPSVGYAATATVQFQSACRGTITQLGVWYHRTNTNTTTQLTLYVRLYDLESQTYAYQSGALAGKVMSAVDTADTLTVAVPVEANHNYRLELSSKGAVFSGTIGFGVMGTEALTGTVTGNALTTGAVQETIAPEIPAAQVAAVVHYSGGDQGPAVTLNGQAMQAETARQGVSLRGEACTEQEFVLTGSWSDALTLAAAFQSAGQDMIVYDVMFYFL